MEVKTFVGGAYLPHYKSFTEEKAIASLPVPGEVIIPLLQHSGAPNQPLVEAGEKVRVGQKIGDADELFCAPVHASISGTVVAVEPRPSYTGGETPCIVIEADEGPHQFVPDQTRDPEQMSREELIAAIREGGLVGMGGAAFPTHVNVNTRKPVDTLLLNGAECEPFLTCDHRIMVEKADELVAGAEILMRCMGATRCLIGIEVNKPDAIEILEARTRDQDGIEVVPLDAKYPQGYKSQLIKATTGRDVPRKARSADLGCIVRNVGTTVAAYDAVVSGKPLIERVLTVSGPHVPRPGNYLVKIGTPLYHILQECGVDDLDDSKVIMGGPMTGLAQSDLNVSIVKSTTGVVVLPPDMVEEEIAYEACVRCGKCVEHCPMLLYPNQISIYAEADLYDSAAQNWDLDDCIECGVCAYVCPSYRPIVHFVQRAKAELSKRQK